ncbi:Hint domain-containing protein [uncultured Roseovarius sp.]|uniref:Hint domain-containing protein n=1 Tax=uncultured Roseovarius sp. TaxID=293344 RepID=UPI00260B81AE|nr:Hint domain-containing protein [uncultured Roseovarius sp.]
MTSDTALSDHIISVYQGLDFRVVNGANMGDALSFAAELDLDDVYELQAQARQFRLSLSLQGGAPFTIAQNSDMGRPGAQVHLDSCLTLMSGTGRTTEMLVLVEVDDAGNVVEVFAMPLAQMRPKTGYALVGIDTDDVLQRFAQVACVSFSRGTHITMATGEQRRVETLAPGDMVLTRDDGVRPIRWVGQSTVRAVGDFAPIRIVAGALHNEHDLLVSPDHRLFIYQRSDALGAGRAEVLVRARHLVNGDTVRRESGGFVEYVQLLFDRHQIIYAEGIAAETLLVDPRTSAALPADLKEALSQQIAGKNAPSHLQFEVGQALLNHPNAADILKRASTR